MSPRTKRITRRATRRPPASGRKPTDRISARDVSMTADELQIFHCQFQPLFQSREQRSWSLLYLCGQLSNLERKTIEPILRSVIEPGSLVNTDEYVIYNRLPEWGYEHKTVCHAAGEYARDEDGDGFCEVHVNTIEGFWSLTKRGIGGVYHSVSKKHLQDYLSEYAWRYNRRNDSESLFESLLLRASLRT